jgi:chromosome segregation ATPase
MSRAELAGAERSVSECSTPESFTAKVPAPARRKSRLLGIPSGELSFSILTGEHQGRQVRIGGAKCTIGSGRGCTLRLRARGVAPLHCWILRGAGGTIVRRRHRDTQLNGCTFEDSILAPGDRLRIGSVELEVTTCPTWSAGWSIDTAHPTPIYDELDRELWERTARESSESIDRLRREMQDLERRATGQLAELNELIGRVSTERDALQDQLLRTQFDSTSQRDTFFLEKQRLESSLASCEQELAEVRSHLTTREVEIESVLLTESRRVNDIQNRLEDVLRERSNLEARLHEQTSSLREECAARQIERDNLQDECQRLDAELARLRELVGYTAAERDQLTLNANDAQQLLSQQQGQLHRENRDLSARLEATLARLAEAERRLAVVQVEGDSHLAGEMERVGQLQQRLAQAEQEKSELESQLRDRTSAWQTEQVRLSEQQGRLSEQCLQLEGQLKYVRELVESLASEKQLLCEQLEAADLKLAADQEAFAQERADLAQKLADAAGPLTAAQQRCEQLEAQLSERRYGSDAQAATWKQQADEYEEQIQALCEQLATTTGRLAELQSAGDSNREIESVLAAKRQAQLEEAREELTTLRAKLAELEAGPSIAPQGEQFAEWERRAGELQIQLTAAELRAAAAEDRLAVVQAEFVARASEQDAALALEQRAAESECSRAALAQQLSDLNAAVQFERESWQQDRERLHQECRMLGHRLIQKQKEYDALDEQIKAAAKEAPPVVSANTITMGQIRDEVAAATQLEEERANWWAERDELRRQVDELTAQLAARPEFTQQMTMGPEAIADLQAQARAGQEAQEAQQRVSTLELELESARCQLEESRAWRERAELAARELEERQAQNHQLREALASAERELAAAREAAVVPIAAVTSVPVSDDAQLAALEERERQQAAEIEQARSQLATEADALAAAKQELAAAQQEQQATQAEFEGRWKMWEENLRRQEELLQEQADELAQRVAAAESQLADSANLEQAFAAREAELAAEANRLAEIRSELQRQQAELSEQAAAGASQSEVADIPVPRAVDEQAPETELPREFEAVGEIEPPAEGRDSAVPEHFAPQFIPSSPAIGETPKPVWNQPGQDPPADDDSIEAYMSRLLKRVRGDAPLAAPALKPALAPQPVVATPTPLPVDVATVQPPAIVEPVKPEEYVPRQKAPELTTNLAAMRELANSAARTAIVKHQKRSGSRQALMQSVGAMLTLVCGLVAAFGAYYFRSLPGAIAAGIGLAVALYWGGKAAIRVLRLMMLKAPGCKDDHDEPESATASSTAGESLCATADACQPEPPADPTETLHPDYIAPELSQPQDPRTG